MKCRCPYCGRKVRVAETGTPRPWLVVHQVRDDTRRRNLLPAKTTCYGSRLPLYAVASAKRFDPQFLEA